MIFGEGRAKDAYRRVLWGPVAEGLVSLPGPWDQWVVRALGRSAVRFAGRKHQEVLDNLMRAFPSGVAANGSPLEQVVSDAFATHFANQYIGFSFPSCGKDNWSDYLEIRGLDVLQSHVDEGKGVVLAHPHMGPAQLPLHVLGVMGLPMVQVGGGRITRVTLSETGEWARQRRAQLESRMPVDVHDGKHFLRPLLRSLASGSVVMTAADGTGGGEEIGRRLNRSVLEHSMGIAVGSVWLAAMSGAPLLTLHCFRNPRPGSMYVAEIGSEIPLDRDQPMDGILEDGADHLGDWLDRILRSHPGDWLFWDGFAPGALLP
jgi:KDO2-lipid IV(A) lauroyltransferase